MCGGLAPVNAGGKRRNGSPGRHTAPPQLTLTTTIGPFTHYPTNPPTHSPTPSPTHPLTHSPTHPLPHADQPRSAIYHAGGMARRCQIDVVRWGPTTVRGRVRGREGGQTQARAQSIPRPLPLPWTRRPPRPWRWRRRHLPLLWRPPWPVAWIRHNIGSPAPTPMDVGVKNAYIARRTWGVGVEPS